MDVFSEDNLVHACRVLFGSGAPISRSFLHRLGSKGLKKAYRKRALLTHPDRVAHLDEETRRKSSDMFVETTRAYEQLVLFIKEKQSGPPPTAHAPAAAPPDERERPSPRKRDERVFTAPRFYSGLIPRRPLPFGQFLYYNGVIPHNALIEAIIWQRRQRPRFGEIARHWSMLSDEDIRRILSLKEFAEPVGKAAARLRLLSNFQVGAILYYQRKMQRPIGEYFVAGGYIDQVSLADMIRVFAEHNARFSRRHAPARSC